jgi:uncharacterized protein YbgA (DUF1722 family)
METFCDAFLSSAGPVSGFILKNRSPSCGPGDVKIYRHADKPDVAGKGSGLFAASVLEKCHGAAVEDEGRLKNFKLREHFLTKLFTLTRWKQVRGLEKAGALVEFQAKHKFLIMAYSQKQLRILGKITANHERRSITEQLSLYEEHLHEALRSAPRRPAMVNVLEHLAGFFSKERSTDERAFFRETLELYREGRIPLSSVLVVIKTWALRDENQYLLDQALLSPYPAELIELKDSGRLLEM